MNNPMEFIVSAIRNGGDANRIVRDLATRDQRAARALAMMQNNSPAQLQQIVNNMCKERGTTPESIAQSLGLF